MDSSTVQTVVLPPDAVFGSADPIAFAFAIVASILASFTLMDQLAGAIKRGAILSIIKGMRLIFAPEAVDSFHLHGDIWARSDAQNLLINHPGLMHLMLRHPCAWSSCPDLDRANLAMTDFVNLSCIRVLDDYDGTTKIMFLFRWAISSVYTLWLWHFRSNRAFTEKEFNKELDQWFLCTIASCTDMSEEEMRFLEKIASLRMLRWNRFIGDDAQKLAWEVPQRRKYTTLWLLLGMREILGTYDKEGYHNIGKTGTWVSIDHVGMAVHFRFGRKRLGFWTACRIWNLEDKQWKAPAGHAELAMSPKLSCQHRLTSDIPDFGNCVDVSLNSLFFMRTEKALVNDLLHLIETLGPNHGQGLLIPDDQLASPIEIMQLSARSLKSWCRCTSMYRSLPSYLCCVPVCTIFLRGEAIANIANLPLRASGQIVYIIIPNGKGLPAQVVPMDAPLVKQGDKDIITCMIAFRGKVILDTGAAYKPVVP
ncbi:hypothetical protein ACHAP8_011685 [Fusarium lateritium]